MRKLAPIMAIGSGLLAIVVGIISLLMAHDVINSVDWVNTYNSKTSPSTDLSKDVIFGIQVGFGAIAVMLGVSAFKRGRGFAAFLLLIIFAAATGFGFYVATKDDVWNTMTIVSLVVYSLATLGLTLGLLLPKR